MNIIFFEKYKNFKSGLIFFDIWMELNRTPFLENVKWALYIKIIFLNFALLQITYKKFKSTPT